MDEGNQGGKMPNPETNHVDEGIHTFFLNDHLGHLKKNIFYICLCKVTNSQNLDTATYTSLYCLHIWFLYFLLPSRNAFVLLEISQGKSGLRCANLKG